MKIRPLFQLGLFVIILIIGVVARTYRLETPLADWHSWRQADTAAVARNFVQEDFNLLYPRSDSLWSLSEGQLPNPNRYFINEFPLYNAIVAVIYQQFGISHIYARMVSIAFATLGAAALFGLVKLLLGFWPALLSLLYYQLLPYNIYYSRVVMPDPIFTALSVIALYFCALWVKNNKKVSFIAMLTTFALATLVKPYAIFISLPILYWIIANRGLGIVRTRRFYLFSFLALLPLLLWRYHIHLHPEGSFASKWLLNGDGIRFTGAFFRWLIYDRLNRLIFASGGFVLMIAGLLTAHLKKTTSFFFVWMLAIFLYFTIFAKGNVNHDYYQLPVVAPGVVLAVIGATSLVKLARNNLARIFNLTFVTGLFLLSIAFGWYEVRGFFNINNPAIVEAGQAIDRLAPSDALVIAPYMGDPAFLYQTNRSGWPVGGEIEQKIEEGASYYVTTSFDDEFNSLRAKYSLIEQTNHYAIIELKGVGEGE